jgi:curli biogenesis system outer membrane secretion channel CsgG
MRTLISRQWAASALLLSVSFALSAQDKEIKTLAKTIAESLQKTSKKTAAVVDFTDLQGNVTELGRYLAEEVSVALAESGTGLEVVDRTNLKALLQENKLAASGIIDAATARKVGQIAGVDVLITGTITPFGDSVKFAVKALDAASARIVTASSTEIPKTRAIEELLGRGLASPQPGGSGNTVGHTQSQKSALTTEAQDFRFTLQSCRLAGSAVICNLTVQNESADDRNLLIYYGNGYSGFSRIIDDRGRETNMDELEFGGKSGGRATLVPGVQTILQATFDHVSSDISAIAQLEMTCYFNQNFKVKFRQVSISSR